MIVSQKLTDFYCILVKPVLFHTFLKQTNQPFLQEPEPRGHCVPSDERARHKFTKNGMIISNNTGNLQTVTDGEKIQFVFHILLGKKMNEIMRSSIHGMMNEIVISSNESKGGKAIFLQDAERNAATSRGSSPDTSLYHWSRFGKGFELGRVSRLPKRKDHVQKHPILNGCISFQKGELMKRGGKHALRADDVSSCPPIAEGKPPRKSITF